MLTATFDRLKNAAQKYLEHRIWCAWSCRTDGWSFRQQSWWYWCLSLVCLLEQLNIYEEVWGMATKTLKPQRYVHDIMSISKAHIFSVATSCVLTDSMEVDSLTSTPQPPTTQPATSSQPCAHLLNGQADHQAERQEQRHNGNLPHDSENRRK